MSAFVFLSHAEDMLLARGLERSWVLRVIEHPAFDEPDPIHAHRRRAFGPVAERDGRMMRVVYEKNGETIIIVTVFLDRGRKR